MRKVARSTQMKGVKAVVRVQGAPAWTDAMWHSWPHLSIAMDQGPDGVAAVWWLQAQGANISCWPDPSHGAWADTKQAVRDCKLLGF